MSRSVQPTDYRRPNTMKNELMGSTDASGRTRQTTQLRGDRLKGLLVTAHQPVPRVYVPAVEVQPDAPQTHRPAL